MKGKDKVKLLNLDEKTTWLIHKTRTLCCVSWDLSTESDRLEVQNMYPQLTFQKVRVLLASLSLSFSTSKAGIIIFFDGVEELERT